MCNYLQKVTIDAENRVVEEGDMDLMANTLYFDRHQEKGLFAKIFEDDGEMYLQVDTSKTGTSCTLKERRRKLNPFEIPELSSYLALCPVLASIDFRQNYLSVIVPH